MLPNKDITYHMLFAISVYVIFYSVTSFALDFYLSPKDAVNFLHLLAILQY